MESQAIDLKSNLILKKKKLDDIYDEINLIIEQKNEFEKRFNLLEKAKELGKYLKERLYSAQKEFPDFISEIRGIGLWYAFDVTPVNLTLPLVKEMENRGVIVGSMLNSDGTIRIAPPLVIRPAEIDAFIGVLKASLRELKNKDRDKH